MDSPLLNISRSRLNSASQWPEFSILSPGDSRILSENDNSTSSYGVHEVFVVFFLLCRFLEYPISQMMFCILMPSLLLQKITIFLISRLPEQILPFSPISFSPQIILSTFFFYTSLVVKPIYHLTKIFNFIRLLCNRRWICR